MPHPTSAARPKRVGEDFNRTHDNTTKKPRFDYRNPSTLAADAPEDDLILDADVIGKSGNNTKRNAVNIDGYESDSDNDNFNARAARKDKKKPEKSQDEEEDDMFADLEEKDGDDDEEVQREGKGKGKDVRFMEGEEIEGQVMNSTSGGKVSDEILLGGKGKQKASKEDEEDESSGDEEERDKLDEEMEDELAAEIGAGGKKKHAPRLDAFNLKDEEQDGRFDESGNYVRKAADPDAVNDNWLDGLSKKDMKKAKEAQEKREDERRRKAMADDAMLTSDLRSTLISRLETGESPLEALQRLNRGKPQEKKIPKWKQKKQRNGMDVDEPAESGHGTATDPKEEARRKAVEAITGAADALYSRGQLEIYEAERELLMRQYRKETGEDWQSPVEAAAAGADEQDGALSQWEYRWSDARDGGEAHGPYDAPTMKAWNDAGYFGEGVEFREVGGSEWSRLLDIS
ncbi:LIN1-like protein [Fulvia fulva]|nr:LIN1-like protein [Fulvia fulva]KAK4622590.1 LIN1-like protein [Fulvia fulva]WPV16423.1 LIN1-like protein [Fulvia fulva]WPV30926.1 LIN1-like protein [Fulvia fulva]